MVFVWTLIQFLNAFVIRIITERFVIKVQINFIYPFINYLIKFVYIISEVNQCLFRDPCKNGARCKFLNETLQCVCAPGFTGQYCEKSN